ncbi:hypothetical protein B0H10DRAFT_1957902 [Mycena sp. CBHHK59/15]|nr:hypothetical protein B0H10DRAFT_1968363 [Mycena sp. CBHHK59/15]KAJ6603162.1 hypothetical protein B0H10DRAFT_1957902 [Mycena sp. CBHHK59/15]
MASSSWNWGLPGIHVPHPPTDNSHDLSALPPPYEDLKFNPLGLYNLRRRLGVLASEPGIFNTYQQRFEDADIAWLASGASEDGTHAIGPSAFFPAFFALRASLPSDDQGRDHRKRFSDKIRRVLYNLATMWDRAFGGSTIILHVDGTTAPNTLLTPDRLKADVHLPPHFVSENPDSHLAIAHIVQTFIEYVGLPTVERWTRSARAQGWSLSQGGNPAPAQPPSDRLVPAPRAATSHHVFRGRPWRNLPPLATSQQAPSLPPPSSLRVNELSDEVRALTAELTSAREMADERIGVIVEYEDRQDELLQHEQELLEQQFAFKEEIALLRAELKARPVASAPIASLSLRSPPSTPSRKAAVTPINPTSPSIGRTLVTSSLARSSTPTFRSSPSVSAPRTADVPIRVAVVLGPTTEKFLRDNDLDYLRVALEVVVRKVSPVMYHDEVNRLELGDELSEALLLALSTDTYH